MSQVQDGQQTDFALDVVGLPEVIYTSEGEKYLHLPGLIVTENLTGEVRYLLTDGLGSVRHATDDVGTVVYEQSYDPYGNPLYASSDAYGYTGEWWVEEIGLLHLRARWYDPGTGTFLSRDAVESEPPYLYARGNPANLTDPSGNIPPAIVAAGIYIGGAVVYSHLHQYAQANPTFGAVYTGISYVTGWENMRQDWNILNSSCTSLLQKLGAGADMVFNIVQGAYGLKGLGMFGSHFTPSRTRQLLSVPDTKVRQWLKEAREQGTQRVPMNSYGEIGKYGDIAVSSFDDRLTQSLSEAHELGHRIYFLPRYGSSLEFRIELNQFMYNKSPLFVYLEEAFVETRAYWVNGYSLRYSLGKGLPFPIQGGYIDDSNWSSGVKLVADAIFWGGFAHRIGQGLFSPFSDSDCVCQ